MGVLLAGICLLLCDAGLAETPLETLENHEVSGDGRATVAKSFENGMKPGRGDERADGTTARIAVVNAHSGGNSDRNGYGRWLARQKPDLALVCEAVGMAPHLGPVGRTFNAGMETRGRREVAIVVRKGLRVLEHEFGKVSPDLGSGIAHDRWWTRIETRVAGLKSRVYSLHLNAVIQQKDGNPLPSNRWNVTREALEDLEKRWKEDIEAGWAVIIGGDFNWNNGRDHARSHPQAPGRIFQRLGLTFVNTELMWLAWTPRTHALAGKRIVPATSVPGLHPGEHPSLLIDLRARLESDKADPDNDRKDDDVRDGKPGQDGPKNAPNDGEKKDENGSKSLKTPDEIVRTFLDRINRLIERLTRALKKITSLLGETKRR